MSACDCSNFTPVIEQEDSVLVTPEEKNLKPYIAFIKEINQSNDGSIILTGQWLYRPEEAEKRSGGNWVSSDSRELFYSFHRDEVSAEAVMHKCVIHFIPSHKQAPLRSKHPGFIVRKVYDPNQKKLWNLTDEDYEDSKQAEINLLVEKTRDVLGDLPDIDHEDAAREQDTSDKDKRQIRKRTMMPLRINKENRLPTEVSSRKVSGGQPDTPGSSLPSEPLSEGHLVLLQAKALTKNRARDRWLEKLVQAVKYVCKLEMSTGDLPEVEDLMWPDAAVSATSSLERQAYEILSSDMHKYNIKMRQLEFNLKNSTLLAQRLLKCELDASKVLIMTPAELKEGLTAEEKSAQEPEEPETMQMADVRCAICGEKKVGVKDIIHVGYGDRYQLECLKCGHSWYSSRDSIASLTIQTVAPKQTVGTAPASNPKLDEVEKATVSTEGQKQGILENQTIQQPVDEPVKSIPSRIGDCQ
ncbi:hypothetical protein KP509_23G070700 [Ceratopteris richardii]|uniref:Uncharacterized protein n=1 Tax=Ceratopteris richardii TaxID=49495 RepID=A0A8T2S0Y9_CERRI|nr:hypothetical protein KP509_23G070700 [Ceratopteris richardii]